MILKSCTTPFPDPVAAAPGHYDLHDLTAVGAMTTVPPRRVEPRAVLDLADRLIAEVDGGSLPPADLVEAADLLQLLALMIAENR